MTFDLTPTVYFDDEDISGESTSEESGSVEEEQASSQEEGSVETPEEAGSSEESPKNWEQEYSNLYDQYKNLEQKLGQQGQELGKFRRHQDVIQQLEERPDLKDKLIQPEPEPTDELIGGMTKTQLEELQYSDPVKAQMLVTQHLLEKKDQQYSQEQAQKHNDEVIIGRGRELLVEEAKNMGNSALEEKFKDPSYQITAYDIQQFPKVLDKIEQEWNFIQNNFKPQNGRHNSDAFRKADILMNHNNYIRDTKVQTAEQTALNIQNGAPRVRASSPGQGSKAEVKASFHEGMDEMEARSEASKMSREEREALLNEF